MFENCANDHEDTKQEDKKLDTQSQKYSASYVEKHSR